MSSSDPRPEIAAFEALWILRVLNLVGEIASGLRPVNALVRDKATSRAIVDGDLAARNETLRAFLVLGRIYRRFDEDFAPAPRRYETLGQILGQAFASIAKGATAFEESTREGVDFDGLGTVVPRLAEATRLIEAVIRAQTEPEETAAPAPAPPRKPRRAKGPRATDD